MVGALIESISTAAKPRSTGEADQPRPITRKQFARVGRRQEEFDRIASILFAVMAVKLYAKSVRIFDFNLGLRRRAFGVCAFMLVPSDSKTNLAIRNQSCFANLDFQYAPR